MQGWGETGDTRENPPTSGIVQRDSHVQKIRDSNPANPLSQSIQIQETKLRSCSFDVDIHVLRLVVRGLCERPLFLIGCRVLRSAPLLVMLTPGKQTGDFLCKKVATLLLIDRSQNHDARRCESIDDSYRQSVQVIMELVFLNDALHQPKSTEVKQSCTPLEWRHWPATRSDTVRQSAPRQLLARWQPSYRLFMIKNPCPETYRYRVTSISNQVYHSSTFVEGKSNFSDVPVLVCNWGGSILFQTITFASGVEGPLFGNTNEISAKMDAQIRTLADDVHKLSALGCKFTAVETKLNARGVRVVNRVLTDLTTKLDEHLNVASKGAVKLTALRKKLEAVGNMESKLGAVGVMFAKMDAQIRTLNDDVHKISIHISWVWMELYSKFRSLTVPVAPSLVTISHSHAYDQHINDDELIQALDDVAAGASKKPLDWRGTSHRHRGIDSGSSDCTCFVPEEEGDGDFAKLADFGNNEVAGDNVDAFDDVADYVGDFPANVVWAMAAKLDSNTEAQQAGKTVQEWDSMELHATHLAISALQEVLLVDQAGCARAQAAREKCIVLLHAIPALLVHCMAVLWADPPAGGVDDGDKDNANDDDDVGDDDAKDNEDVGGGGLICTVQRYDGNTARLVRRNDEALGVRVSVAPSIQSPFLEDTTTITDWRFPQVAGVLKTWTAQPQDTRENGDCFRKAGHLAELLDAASIENKRNSNFSDYFPRSRYDGNTARLARRGDEALGVRVSVARIAPSFLDLGRAGPSHSLTRSATVSTTAGTDRSGVVARLLASHIGEPGSIPSGVAPRIFACGNRAGRCRWLASKGRKVIEMAIHLTHSDPVYTVMHITHL
ncbi:hypothetical protein PR048_007204 [Dryococelus australis]|uniref:Uncharacterized protein n=1 Tax=Dryococelus australis TaxID=614101 RepID=A0ABQ9IDJ7_9NEOP|nr:hypothetical protein PR048_007204 [Dryococelus australis]